MSCSIAHTFTSSWELPTCHLTMVRSHCVINSWKMGLVVFGAIVCQCGYFNPSNDNPTNISGFLGPLWQVLFYPPFLDATKTKKKHTSEAQGISSGVAVENLPIFQVAGADAVPRGFMVGF